MILAPVSALIPAGNICLYQNHHIHHSFSSVHLLKSSEKNFYFVIGTTAYVIKLPEKTQNSDKLLNKVAHHFAVREKHQ